MYIINNRGVKMTIGERFVKASNNFRITAGKNRKYRRRDHLCAEEDIRA